MSFTVARANTYFAGHIQRRTWNEFAAEDKTAALVHAERILRRAAGRALVDTVTTDADQPREDLAVFEQALYLLRNGPATQQGGLPGHVSMDQANPSAPREQDMGAICPEAMRWMSVPNALGGPVPLVELIKG